MNTKMLDKVFKYLRVTIVILLFSAYSFFMIRAVTISHDTNARIGKALMEEAVGMTEQEVAGFIEGMPGSHKWQSSFVTHHWQNGDGEFMTKTYYWVTIKYVKKNGEFVAIEATSYL